MLAKLKYYLDRLYKIQTLTQNKLDQMDDTDGANEDLYYKREEQLEVLEEIIEGLEQAIEGIENFNNQWNGLKSIK